MQWTLETILGRIIIKRGRRIISSKRMKGRGWWVWRRLMRGIRKRSEGRGMIVRVRVGKMMVMGLSLAPIWRVSCPCWEYSTSPNLHKKLLTSQPSPHPFNPAVLSQSTSHSQPVYSQPSASLKTTSPHFSNKRAKRAHVMTKAPSRAMNKRRRWMEMMMGIRMRFEAEKASYIW